MPIGLTYRHWSRCQTPYQWACSQNPHLNEQELRVCIAIWVVCRRSLPSVMKKLVNRPLNVADTRCVGDGYGELTKRHFFQDLFFISLIWEHSSFEALKEISSSATLDVVTRCASDVLRWSADDVRMYSRLCWCVGQLVTLCWSVGVQGWCVPFSRKRCSVSHERETSELCNVALQLGLKRVSCK